MLFVRFAAWLLVSLMLLYPMVLRGYFMTWGATAAEVRMPFPGDEIIPNPKAVSTRAITIDAPPEAVWPWLVQIGCDRAGWYSYDRLDNGGAPSATRLHLEWQDLKAGSEISMVPSGAMKVPVVQVEPGHFMALGGILNMKSGGPADYSALPERYWGSTMSFVVEDAGNGKTRLIHRSLYDWGPHWSMGLIITRGTELASFIMEQKMMRGIKQRAESMSEEERALWRTRAAASM